MREPAGSPAAPTDSRGRGNGAIALVIALLACAAVVVAVSSADEDEPQTTPTAQEPSEKVDLSGLRSSTTHSVIKAAPRDENPQRDPGGTVVHPRRATALYDSPEGEPFAKIGAQQFGDTWLPVIDEEPGWVQVLLPSKPNGSTGWVSSDAVDRAHSPFLVRVHLGSRTLELFEDGASIGSWTVAVGASGTPTPAGRTFLLGQLTDPDQSFSPVILPLGTHSQTLDTYGGGPGTVAIHGWTDPSVFGQAISHGCIRVPDDALSVLRTIPLGTSVLIDTA